MLTVAGPAFWLKDPTSWIFGRGLKWKPRLAVKCFFGTELELFHDIARAAHAITFLPAQSLAESLPVFSFARSASTTSVGTNGETSPLRRATSLTRRELRKE
ncbi:MAG: hypothetical protein RIS24_104 [Verrucomicrobiota bacterium]